MMFRKITFFIFFLIFNVKCFGDLYLRENLDRASPGDYIVTYQNKTYTLMLVQRKEEHAITIQEISVPQYFLPKKFSWKEWAASGAPNHTCWVRYSINLNNGNIQNYFSLMQNKPIDISKTNLFLSTLLNLRLTHVPYKDRKKIARGGGTDWSNLWQPKMVLEGKTISNVPFEAWKTYWPRDSSELGGKEILVYVPAESEKYPSYFPYWLQISGLVEKAKIRIVDSGRNMKLSTNS